MCGIAGIIDLSKSPIDSNIVKTMCNNMLNRGPDAWGLESMSHAVLGHRRLSILDLSNVGNQPMSTPDGRFWIVFNGEIYNHLELRRILEKDGFKYHTRTDTETLLYGYQKWGTDLPQYCRGMWSFVIWDSKEQILFSSRDRLGQKPFYYSIAGERFSFASTLSGLSPSIKDNSISHEAVASLLSYEYIPHTECIYEGVKKLPPAHNLLLTRDNLYISEYWNLDYREKLDISLEEAMDLVEETIDSAVQEQLVADVPLGVFLSGGVDSGYIAALAAKHKPGITTITMGVPESMERDESKAAKRIAEKHGTNHIEVPLDDSCIRNLPRILSSIEPLGDSSLIPVSAVSEKASKYLSVVLTGDGGDEGFGGYGRPQLSYRADIIKNNKLICLWKLLGPAMALLSRQRLTPFIRLFRLYSSGSRMLAGAGLKNYLETWDATPYQVKKLIYGDEMVNMLDRQPGKFIIDMHDKCLANNGWDSAFGLQIKTRLTNDFLFKVDSGTMHHSIESRAPFLDYRLLEIAAKLPYDILFPDDQSKSLLKKTAVKHNPFDVVYGKKKGFSIPVEKYFLGDWGNLMKNLIFDGVASQMGILNPNGVLKYLNKHGLRQNYRLDRQLYSILVLEIWLRTFHEKVNTPDELGQKLISGHSLF
jgi:asparagine synthase (glutamine-hydrolysing)